MAAEAIGMSPLDFVFRRFYLALNGLVGGRAQPFPQALGLDTPYILYYFRNGGAEPKGHRPRMLVYNITVRATSLKISEAFALHQAIYMALADRAYGDTRHQGQDGPFGLDARDAHGVRQDGVAAPFVIMNVTELGTIYFNDFYEKAVRFTHAGYTMEVKLQEA